MPRLGTAEEDNGAAPSLGRRAGSAADGLREKLGGEHLRESAIFIGLGCMTVMMSFMRFGDPNLSHAALSPLGFPLLLALDALFIFVYADALPVTAEPVTADSGSQGSQAGPRRLLQSDPATQGQQEQQIVSRLISIPDDPRKLALLCACLKCVRLAFDFWAPGIATCVGLFDLFVTTERFYGQLAGGKIALRETRLMSSLLNSDAILYLPAIGKAVLVMDVNVEIGMSEGPEHGPMWQEWAVFVLGVYVLGSAFMMACPAGIGYSVVTSVGLFGIGLSSAQSGPVRVLAVVLAVGNAGYVWQRRGQASAAAPAAAPASGGGQAIGRAWGAGQSLGGAGSGQKGNLADLRQNLLQGAQGSQA